MEKKSLSGKIKTIILLSLFHQKYHRDKDKMRLESAFLINKEYLKPYYLDEINDMIKQNDKIQEKINNIDINDILENNIDSFIKDLDYDILKKYDDDISIIEKELPYEVEKEEIKLYESGKANIFKDFFIIYTTNNISGCFENNFRIKFLNSDNFFGTYNGKDIILDYPNYLIYILILNEETKAYNIEYILAPKEKNLTFFNQLSEVITFGYNDYFNNHFLFNKDDNSKDYISSIFVNDEIVGNCYRYSSDIKDYTNQNDYTKYLKYEVLTNILSLYSFNIQIRKKTTSMILFKEYYLVKSKFLNEIKMESNFSDIYNSLEKNINNIYFDEKTNKKNLYFMIKNLPIDLIEGYTDKKINNEYDINDIVPEQTEINCNEKEPLLIYDNFEIIDEKILDIFVKDYKNDNILAECIFNEGKIIINLPKDLNKKIFVSLIGYMKEGEFNSFVSEYILIFKSENNRKKQIYTINFDFNNYLNSLKFNKKCYKNKDKNIIIAKYDEEKIVDKYESQDINFDNDKDNNKNEENKIINKSDKIKDNFESCPNIGLRNIGATCYMNATLQCFCHIEKFIEYFKYNQQMKENNSNNKLSVSFKILIDELWPNNYNPSSPNNKKDYAPNEFKDKISKLNPLFEGIAANDAKDLVNFIIMTLHLELNKTIENKNNENKNYGNIDQTNKQAIFDIFNEEVITKNNSIISKLFYATNCNATRCCNCNTQIYNFQTYFFIVFPLEEVRKFKIDLINQKNQNYQMMNYYQNQFLFNFNLQFQNNNYIINQSYQNYNYPNNQQCFYNNFNIMNQQNQYNNNNMNHINQNCNYYPNNQQVYNNNSINNQNNNIMNQNNQQFYNNNNYINNQQNQNGNNMNQNNHQFYNNNCINNQQNQNSNNMNQNHQEFYNNNNCTNNQQNQNNNNMNQNNQSNNTINNNEVNLLDCFDYDKKPNMMSGQNAMYCNTCKAICDCVVCTNLITGPEILILLLNRGNGKEFDIKIIFEENLDLTKYIKNDCKYKLMGVISHLGESGMGGHFIAYCKDPITKEWYKYNDSLVNKVEDFKKEVIDFAMPYLLFYEKINNE